MYEPQDTTWLTLTFLATAICLAVILFRARKKKVRAPRKLTLGLWVLAVVQLVLMLGTQQYQHWKLRRELLAIAPSEVTNLELSRSGITKEVKAQAEVVEFFTLFKSIKNLPAHHSHPVDKIDISFDYRGNRYHYQLGQDSKEPNEYWVFPGGRLGPMAEEIEFARIQSPQLGSFVSRVLRDK
jgi:hypothetical protein